MKDMQKLLCWRFGQLPPPSCPQNQHLRAWGASATPSTRGLGLGSLGLYLYFVLNFLTNTLKIIQHFLIGETNHFDTKTLEKRSAFNIFCQTFWGVVLRTVKFDNQFSRGTIKIWNKIPDGALTQPSFRTQSQALIPQFFLSFSHPRPQFLRSRSQCLGVTKPFMHPQILAKYHPHKTPSWRGSPLAAGGVPRSSLP